MDTRSLETASAATLALVGLVLLLPASTFAANPVAFGAMRFLPETVWGGLFMALGLWQSYAVVVNRPALRRWASLGAMAVFGFLAALYFLANPLNLGTPTWVVYALGNGWSLHEGGRDA